MASASGSAGKEGSRVEPDILMVEPFFCGSHRQLVECLMRDSVIAPRVHLVTMSGKKWHWRARVAALHLTSAIPRNHHFRVLVSSSVLNLAELVALRPDLTAVHKVLYFHENQLHYPVRKTQERDFQYGYNQILSCLVADSVLFNSAYNMESFLTSIHPFLKLMPDYRPQGLADVIRPKCSVLHFPIHFTPMDLAKQHSTPAKTAPQAKTLPPDVSRDLNVNSNRSASSSEMDVSMKEMDSDSFLQSLQTDTSCGSDRQTDQALRSAEIHTPTRTVDSCDRLLQHSQPKPGIMDTQSVINASDIKCTPAFNSEGSRDGLTHQAQNTRNQVALPSTSCWSTKSSCAVHSVPSSESSTCPPQVRMEMDSVGPVTVLDHAHRKTHSSGPGGPHCESLGKGECLHIVWPHRWEHDKDPQTFFETLFRLQAEKLQFVVSVLGEMFTDVPEIFGEAEQRLKGHIGSWGYQADKAAYYRILQQADVVVSTSKHEFFGVAMLEAVYMGCYPLCPKSLVYPEFYPESCLYSTPTQLFKRLRSFCQRPHLARNITPQMDLHKFSWETLRPAYLSKLQIQC